MLDPDWQKLLSEQAKLNGRLFYRRAYCILKDDASAQDVCQQAFLRAFEQRERINPHGNRLRNWLVRAATTGALELIRRRGIEQRVTSDPSAATDGLVEGAWVAGEMREAVLAALGRLAEPMRSAVVLRHMEEMDGKEVAELLGCSVSRVSKLQLEGLQELRQILADDLRAGREMG